MKYCCQQSSDFNLHAIHLLTIQPNRLSGSLPTLTAPFENGSKAVENYNQNEKLNVHLCCLIIDSFFFTHLSLSNWMVVNWILVQVDLYSTMNTHTYTQYPQFILFICFPSRIVNSPEEWWDWMEDWEIVKWKTNANKRQQTFELFCVAVTFHRKRGSFH